MSRPIVLLTRPEAQSRRFSAVLRGAEVVIAPILRMVPLDYDRGAADRARRLVFTSENAVALAGQGRGRPALCVGPRTAAAARAAGFDAVEGPGDARGMMPLLADWSDALHLHGVHRAADLPVAGLAVYDQQPQPLGPDAHRVLAGAAPVILPLFSPRSARLLTGELAACPPVAPLSVAAISRNAAAEWRVAPGVPVSVAPAPNAAAMQALVQSLVDRQQS